MYGKAFAEMYKGSMYGAGADVFAVWGFVIANAVDSTVELHPTYVSAVIGMTEERFGKALEWLMRPDSKSRTEAEDGRRLVSEGAYQYHVPSWEKWNNLRNEEDRRAKNREYKRASRLRKRQGASGKSTCVSTGPVNDSQTGQQKSALSAHIDVDVNTNTDVPPDRSARARVVVPAQEPKQAEPEQPPEDDGTWKASGCPLDLVSKLDGLGVVRQLAERLGANPVAVRAELDAFVNYWTIGKGAGQQRTGWPGKARQWVIEQARKPGGLKAPGAIEHETRSAIPADIAKIAGSILRPI